MINLRKKSVVISRGKEITTTCPDCQCEVVVRNKHVMQYAKAKDGVLCDDCRSERLK